MDPELLSRLMGLLNPISSAQAAGPIAPNSLDVQDLQRAEPQIMTPYARVPPDYPQPGPIIPPTPAPPATLAGATTPPPPATPASPVPGVPTPTNPLMAESYRSEPAPAATLGSVLEPHPPVTTGSANAAPVGPPIADTSSVSKRSSGDDLLKTLRGVQMPKPPEVQKVSTPHAPALRPIQSGGLAELMASLGVGPQQAFPGLKLPSTLGQALGGGR